MRVCLCVLQRRFAFALRYKRLQNLTPSAVLSTKANYIVVYKIRKEKKKHKQKKHSNQIKILTEIL